MTTQSALTALPRPAPRQATVPSRHRVGPQLLRLGLAACGDPEVRDSVRISFGRMRQTVAETTGLDPMTIKAFPDFGMLLNNGAALPVAELDEPWAEGVRTRIRPGLFDHITTGASR
ncbi:hypothetical protein [Streptomyces sp. NPDC050355]|uniref:hypothetical protein n=1 Tax=Streptomyces sp. NPDC050355 TaxID=3365609 RepID=UPI0037BA2D9B